MKRDEKNVFLTRSINLTVSSCDVGSLKLAHFGVKLDPFYDLIHENWSPIYADNSAWGQVEFICKIEFEALILEKNHKSNEYKYVIKF